MLYSHHTQNQMYRQLTSICGLNPWLDTNSMPRVQMFATHLGQKLVVEGMTERYWQTGVEQELAKSTFSVKMPCNGRVVKIIHRYRQTGDISSIKENPEVLMIYENTETREVGIIVMPGYCAYHPYFGFKYKESKGMSSVREGAYIKEGTIFLDSPGVTEHGNYMYGREMNMVFMSHPATSEDGIVICRDQLEKLAFSIFETRTVEWGKTRFALNTYGTDTEYKCCPDIGDVIRPDGLLMAFREQDTNLSVVDQTVAALRRVHTVFDKRVYANGGGGIVRDIRVITNKDLSGGLAATDQVLDKYIKETQRFYREILTTWKKLFRESNGTLQITKAFGSLLQRCLISAEDEANNRNTKHYKRGPIDDFRVEFVIEYRVVPMEGFKLTDGYGGKGVICHIAEPHEMPMDANGNRADIIMDSYSTLNRTNVGRLYEQYFNAASRDVGREVRRMLGIERWDRKTKVKLIEIMENDRALFMKAWTYLTGYYTLVSPMMHQWYVVEFAELEDDELIDHMTEVVRDHVTIFGPPEFSPEYTDMVEMVQEHYPPTLTELTYTGYSGNQVTTAEKILIGSVHMMLLEKTGDDWSAVDSGRIQHHGVLAKLTRADKHAEAWRPQPGKVGGETEVRLFAANAGRKGVAELIDRNNNPRTHRAAVEAVLQAEFPTNIKTLIDREKIKYGGAKPLQQFNHITMCGGWQMEYQSLKNLPRSVTSVRMPRPEEETV